MNDFALFLRTRGWGGMILLFAAYVISAKLGLQLAFVNASATAVWPPTGIALAGFLILGFRVWPAVFLGAFLVNFTTAGTVWTSLGIATGNSLEGLAGAYWVRRFAQGPAAFERAPDILKFVGLAGVLATLISATLGVLSLCLSGFAVWASYWKIWMTWWLGDMTGALIVTPFILLWARDPKIHWRRVPEILASLAVIFILGQAVFGGWFLSEGQHFPLAFLGGPLLLWTAYRYGPRETALGGLILSGVALRNTLNHLGPFGGLPPDQALLVLQSFAAVTCVSSLALAAAILERNLAEKNLQKARRAEKSLQDSEKYFRALIENALDVVTILDGQGTVLYVNAGIQAVLGYPPQELAGSDVFRLVHEEDLPRVREKFGALLRDPGQTQSVRFRCRHKDGSWRDLESIGKNALGEPAVRGIIVNSRDISERQIARLSLLESEERFRQLSESTREGIVITREAGILTTNSVFARMFGYTSEEMRGMPVGDLIESGSRSAVLQNIAAGVESAYEFKGLRKDGAVFPAEATGKPIYFEGRDARVACVRDLTRQKKDEKELREQADLMKSIVDNMGEGLLVCDEKGKTLFVNPAAQIILGGQIGDPLPPRGDRKNVVCFSEDGPPLSPEDFPISQTLAGKSSDNVELFVRNPLKPDGIHLVTTSRPIRDLGGAIRGGVSVFRDITENKRNQKEVRKLARIVESSRDLISMSDPDGKNTYLNDAGRRILGIDPETDVAALRPEAFFFGEDLQRLQALDAQEGVSAREKGYWEGEVRLKNQKTNQPVPVHFSVVYIKDPETGKPLGSASIGRDITQRKKMEELARSNKELEQFAYVASHDLQEPLRMVASFVQLLAREYKGKLDATADQYIQEAVSGVMRMQALILDLLAYSRLDSGGRPFEKVDCAEALRQTLAEQDGVLKESGAEVFQSELPVVKGDFNQITQLFQNLIANAVKFRTAAPPEIHVEAKRHGGEWLFCVRDNGIGLEPRYAEQIFEIFKRLHTRREYPGTGIGLAICKKVVTRHGGRIWVESELGKGASFFWTFPALG